MARLLAVGTKAENDLDTPAALIAELEPLAEEGTYRASALELQAFLYAAEKDYTQAMAKIDAIDALPANSIPVGMQGRMEVLRQYYQTRMNEKG